MGSGQDRAAGHRCGAEARVAAPAHAKGAAAQPAAGAELDAAKPRQHGAVAPLSAQRGAAAPLSAQRSAPQPARLYAAEKRAVSSLATYSSLPASASRCLRNSSPISPCAGPGVQVAGAEMAGLGHTHNAGEQGVTAPAAAAAAERGALPASQRTTWSPPPPLLQHTRSRTTPPPPAFKHRDTATTGNQAAATTKIPKNPHPPESTHPANPPARCQR